MVSFNMIDASSGNAPTPVLIASRNSASACRLFGLAILTSGSRIGTRPAAAIRSA